MQLLAPLEQDGVVSYFLGKGVFEGVFNVDDGGLLEDKIAHLQFCDQSFQLFLRLSRHRARKTENEVPT